VTSRHQAAEKEIEPVKNLQLLTVCLLVVTLAGCAETTPSPEQEQASGPNLRNFASNASIDNAIIAQHTLFPYHFATGSATLNELGLRDLAVLAAHYQKYPKYTSRLNVRRGNAAADLYDMRVSAVVNKLVEWDVQADRVEIADAVPGGDGVSSERVLLILDRENKKPSLGTSTDIVGAQQAGSSS
jgi:hypothetical protein